MMSGMRLLIKPDARWTPRASAYYCFDRPTQDELNLYLPLDEKVVWAVDIETSGLEAHNPAHRIVGIGLSGPTHTVYIHNPEAVDHVFAHVRAFLENTRLVAFNVVFEAAFLSRWGVPLRWDGDAYAMFKQLSSDSQRLSWSLEAAQTDVLRWPYTNKDTLTKALVEHGLTKSEMWRLPWQTLGDYCCHDADSTWQLWQVFVPLVMGKYPELWDYHQRYFMAEARLLVETQLRGVQIDVPVLDKFLDDNAARIAAARQAFVAHETVAPVIEEFNKAVLDAWRAKEPAKTTKVGAVSKVWEKWAAREDTLLAEHGFNINSKDQLRWLFYDRLGNKVILTTDTGKPSVSKKVLPALGEAGRLLAEYGRVLKQQQYAQAVRDKIGGGDTLHLQFKSVGTVTGRLGGSGGINCQQQPKEVSYLSSWKARPGHVLVQSDCEALEPVILTQFSEDEALLRIYGADAPVNDLYLYFGARAEGLKEKIRRYYDPLNPTVEGIEKAKKECKRERTIAKVVCLACGYGAGVKKIRETLQLAGVDLSFTAVKAIHSAYWELFHGIKAWERTLQQIHYNTGGWVPSMLGTPIPIDPQFLKDVVNKHTQTSGHQFLQVWLFFIDALRQERQVRMWPWIPDLHDEVIFEAAEEHAEAARQVFIDALALANERCGLTIPIKSTPEIGPNFAAVKMRKDWDDYVESLLAEEDEDE